MSDRATANEGFGQTFKEIYKEMPFGMKAIIWGAGLYAIRKGFQFGEWVSDKIKGPRPPKDTSVEDRETLLKDMTKWWAKPTSGLNDGYYPTELFVGFEMLGLTPLNVINRCESRGDMSRDSIKSLWEMMYEGRTISEEEWAQQTQMDQHKKTFAKDRFSILCGHDDYFYAYSVQKKKLYEFVADDADGFHISEVTTFDGSNEDGMYDLSKISKEDIKNLKAGKAVAPYKEPASESLYKII